MSKEKSKLDYLHDTKQKEISKDGITILEEFVAHGEKGLTFKFYSKKDGKIEKVSGKKNNDGTYSLRITKDDKTDEKTMTKDELLKEFGKNTKLRFATDYIKQNGGKRRSRKSKGSKKSRKGSRKQSGGKRRSRKSKGSKKSRKGSRKQSGGKRRSRKSKGSKKSRKGSRKQSGGKRRKSRKSKGSKK